MKLVNACFVTLHQEEGIDGMFKFIDYCAGISVNRHSTHTDHKKFVDSLIERGHMTPLELGTVYLAVRQDRDYLKQLKLNYQKNPYSKVKKVSVDGVSYLYITTNYRVLVENNAVSDMRFWSGKTQYHVERKTVDIICSRGIADEYARHRSLSPLMKSTRYADELKGGLRFVKPYWFDNAKAIVKGLFKLYLRICSFLYTFFRKCGLKPQEAREVLTLCLETELILCGFIGTSTREAWSRFFKLRCDSAAHPNARVLAEQIQIAIEK